MAVEIFGVDKNSLAERAGIKPHDKLISINGHDITDILDFRFYETNTHLHVVYETAEGERREEKFVKPQYGALGLAFETYLMDRQRSCRNKCVFCFIDQLPPGMRETLYFKDDDDRLSFLFGNYITLTNIDEREIDRIIDGETVAEVLDYVEFNPKKLVRNVETWVTSSMKAGRITPEEGREFLSNYRSGLYGYTYLEKD